MNAVVMGISPDNMKSHQKFRQKYELPFRLLVDEEHRLADELGLWQEKVLYGVKYMGVVRTTIIVGKDGKIAKIFPNVKVPGHALEVEEAVRALS